MNIDSASAASPSVEGYLLHRPALLIPVLPDHRPDAAGRLDGLVMEWSESGLVCRVQSTEFPAGKLWVAGVENDDFVMQFTAVACEGWNRVESSLEGRFVFVPEEQDPLSPGRLKPQLHASRDHLLCSMPEEVAGEWMALGVIRPVLLYRAFVCPECQGLPIFGSGCRNCGSPRLVHSRLIHHYSCAHVAYVEEFLEGAEVTCPKCHRRGLVVGADFENLQGPATCLDCGYCDTELAHVGTCPTCNVRFPLSEALEREISGYDVARLDRMAVLDAR